MKGADQRIHYGHRLVLLAPASPTAPTAVVVAALSLVPLVALSLTPWIAASLRASLTASLCSSLRTSLRAGLCAGLRTSSRNAGRTSGGSGACALIVASSRNAGAVARLRGGASGGAVLGGGVCRGGGTRRGRAGTVELTLNEGEGVLTVLFAIALVSGTVAAVTAVWVAAVAVRLHLGAGLWGIVSMNVPTRA